MATEKPAAKTPEVTYLHCLCESCTHWEIKYIATPSPYDEGEIIYEDYLVCKTCGLEFPIELSLPDRQMGIHWMEKE